ncbi:uncharacterized protein LOC132903133 [Amyelois transitella]|uniref:uncharacterized protein LOC132903133 n=1 Tax=Amyelois transitella TaxID=680683 RepID=UPI0029906B69|nr:uncharacterized protein LOC132903133 [Amyelois transitella]
MVLTRKLKHDTPRLSMGGIDIGMSKEVKLLGLWIDKALTFNAHVAYTCNKALAIYGQLSRAARVSWGLHEDIIRSIYTAVIVPIITYDAAAWAPAVNKLGVQKRLNIVQRGFAQRMTRSYRTVSLNAALVLAGILPLDLKVREAAALYEARRGVPVPWLSGREVEHRAKFAVQPHPAETVAVQFQCLESRADVDANSSWEVCVYTDGSKIEDTVGAALSIWAELYAICEAAKFAHNSSRSTFGVFSDSRSALETVADSGSTHPLALETRSHIKNSRNQGKIINLFWVKAHAGLQGNERADQLAREAALHSKRKPDYDLCPVSFVKRQIRDQSLREWNGRYVNGEAAATTKVFLPDAIAAYKIVKDLGPKAVLTQVLTGHGGFSEYLYKCTVLQTISDNVPKSSFDISHLNLRQFELADPGFSDSSPMHAHRC